MLLKHVRLAALCSVLALAGMPLTSLAVTSTSTLVPHGSVNYQTQFVSTYGSPARYAGTLQLTVAPGGIITGYYRPNGERFITVTGGVDGTSLWLQLGSRGVRVNGRFERGKIVGSALDSHAVMYTFVAEQMN